MDNDKISHFEICEQLNLSKEELESALTIKSKKINNNTAFSSNKIKTNDKKTLPKVAFF